MGGEAKGNFNPIPHFGGVCSISFRFVYKDQLGITCSLLVKEPIGAKSLFNKKANHSTAKFIHVC